MVRAESRRKKEPRFRVEGFGFRELPFELPGDFCRKRDNKISRNGKKFSRFSHDSPMTTGPSGMSSVTSSHLERQIGLGPASGLGLS